MLRKWPIKTTILLAYRVVAGQHDYEAFFWRRGPSLAGYLSMREWKLSNPSVEGGLGSTKRKADSNRRNHFVLKQMAMCGCAIFNMLRDAQMYSEYPLAIKRGKGKLMEIFNPQMLHVLNIYLWLPLKWPGFLGKYSIHGAYGIRKRFHGKRSVNHGRHVWFWRLHR